MRSKSSEGRVKRGDSRFYIAELLIFLILGFVLLRIFSLGVLQYDLYSAKADIQQNLQEKITPKRGDIFIQDKNGVFSVLATNREYQKVFLAPSELVDKNDTADKLATILEMQKDDILNKINGGSPSYAFLKSKLTDEAASKISSLNLKGVYLKKENWRWYPQGNLASHVLGFVGIKNDQKVGRYGLEGYYNDQLAGASGFINSKRDALKRWLMMGDYEMEPAKDGDQLYLTLDQNVQYTAEQKLKELVDKWKAQSGTIIVMEPKTGEIRAMASLPDFDPNEYNKIADMGVFLNPAMQATYEPGSIFKPITMAGALDAGKVTPQTTFTDSGSLIFGRYVIRNAQDKTYGLSTMTQVLEKSINTGAVFAERELGAPLFKKYVDAFGLNKPLGVDLAGEVGGNLSNLADIGRDVNFATAAFGQGITVTPLGIASAIAAIANNGKMMRPHLVEKIVSADGVEKKIEPEAMGQIVSPSAAGKLTAMLVSTVRNGYDKIKIDDYFVAGKTGTAQIAQTAKRGYSEDDTNHSFVGYAPAYDPKFLIFIKLEKPKGIRFASESLAPAFGDLTRYLLNYYEIPPEK